MANPNPDRSGLAPPFEPGQSGNPGGKTSEQRKLEVRNAEMATRLRARMLERWVAQIDADPEFNPPLANEMLKLIKDSEDRGLGAPKQTTELEGGVSVTQITRRLVE